MKFHVSPFFSVILKKSNCQKLTLHQAGIGSSCVEMTAIKQKKRENIYVVCQRTHITIDLLIDGRITTIGIR